MTEISNQEFHQLLADETSKLIAKKLNIYQSQALTLFKKSIVYKDLMDSTNEYNRTTPSELFDLWKNERLTGFPVGTVDIKAGLLKSSIEIFCCHNKHPSKEKILKGCLFN